MDEYLTFYIGRSITWLKAYLSAMWTHLKSSKGIGGIFIHLMMLGDFSSQNPPLNTAAYKTTAI